MTADMAFMRATATLTEIERFGIDAGDVIITKDSETPDDIGVPTIVDSTASDLVCGYHLALIRPDQDEVDPTFLAKQLSGSRIVRYFGQQANGTTRYGLSSAAIAGTRLYLPDPLRQQAVSRLLRLVDAAIEQTAAVVAKLRHVRTGFLHDLLTRGLNDNGKIRDPLRHPEQFQDSLLGTIPNAWISDRLSYFLSSTEYGISSSLSDQGSLPVLRMNNLQNSEAILDDLRYATDFVPESLLLRVGDVLFNRTNSYEHVGRTGIWRGQLPVATFASYLVRLNPAHERLTSELLNLVLNMAESQIRMRRFATPAVQQVNINPTNLQQMHIAAPRNIAEQNEIVRRARESAATICTSLCELHKLKSLKAGITPDLLTGRVCVPETIVAGATP